MFPVSQLSIPLSLIRAVRSESTEPPVQPSFLQVTLAWRNNREPTQVTAIHLDSINAVHSAFINADLIEIYTNIITILIAQTKSVITLHERIGE